MKNKRKQKSLKILHFFEVKCSLFQINRGILIMKRTLNSDVNAGTGHKKDGKQSSNKLKTFVKSNDSINSGQKLGCRQTAAD